MKERKERVGKGEEKRKKGRKRDRQRKGGKEKRQREDYNQEYWLCFIIGQTG